MKYFNVFITRCLEENDYERFSKINEKLLNDTQLNYYEWIDAFYTEHGVLPKPNIVIAESDYDNFIVQHLDREEPIEHYLNKTQTEIGSAYLKKIFNQFEIQTANGISTKAIEDFLESSEQINSISRENAIVGTSLKGKGLFQQQFGSGLPMGVPFLDNHIGGVKPGTYHVFFAPLGCGKTFLLNYITAYQLLQGKKVLYIRGEMHQHEVLARLAGITFGFNSSDKDKLANKDMQQAVKLDYVIDSYLELVASRGGEIVFTERPAPSVRKIKQAYVEHKPDMICIDGIYMLPTQIQKGSTKWEKEEKVSNALREFSKNGVMINKQLWQPRIIGTTQMNREGMKSAIPDATHIQGSIAYGQDVDTLTAMWIGDELGTCIGVKKSRNSSVVQGRMEIMWETMKYGFYLKGGSPDDTSDALTALTGVKKVKYESI